MRYRLLIALAAGAAAFGMPTLAHHSPSSFDMTHPVVVTGTVKEFRFGNPHSWIYLVVPNAQEGADEWEIEGPSIALLARNGWKSTTLQAGEKVHVLLAARKDGVHGGTFMSVTRDNGEVLNTGRL